MAAAGAAAAHKGEHKLRSLMLGRRWYEGSQYPTPGNLAAEAASAGAPTHSGSSGGSGGPNSGSGSGSGDATTIAATHFVRPPKLILRPDGTTLEAHDRVEEELARVSSRDSETMGFHPSHRAAINPTHVYAQHATNPPQMYHPPQMTRGQPSLFDGASAAAEQYRRAAAAAAAGQVFPPYPWSFAPSGATYPGGAPHGAGSFSQFPPMMPSMPARPTTYGASGMPPYGAHGFPAAPWYPPQAGRERGAVVAMKPSGSDGGSDGGSAGPGGSGGSGNTKGSGNSNQAFTGVAKLGGAGGSPAKPKRGKRGAHNTADKTAKRPKKVGSVAKMDDAADCLQLLSERAV